MVLTRIILFANMKNPNADDIIKFKSLQLAKKIEMAEKKLKEYFPNLHTKHENLFDGLRGIKDFRNQMAHCAFTWDDPTVMSFLLWDVKIDEQGFHNHLPVRVTISDYFSKLEEFKSLGALATNLLIELENQMDSEFPGFLNAIRPA